MEFSKFNTVKLGYSKLECNENSVLMRNWWSNVWTNITIHCKKLHYYKSTSAIASKKSVNSLNSWRILLKNNSFDKTPLYIYNIAKNHEDEENDCETIAWLNICNWFGFIREIFKLFKSKRGKWYFSRMIKRLDKKYLMKGILKKIQSIINEQHGIKTWL